MVMEIQKIQSRLSKLYVAVERSANHEQLQELKMHLRWAAPRQRQYRQNKDRYFEESRERMQFRFEIQCVVFLRRLPEHAEAASVMNKLYQLLAPPTLSEHVKQDGDDCDEALFIVDFCDFHDRSTLRMQLVNMYAKPGPRKFHCASAALYVLLVGPKKALLNKKVMKNIAIDHIVSGCIKFIAVQTTSECYRSKLLIISGGPQK